MTGFIIKNKKISPQVKMVIIEILLFLLGFLLMPLRFYFGICPFAISLISATKKYTPFAFAGALLSCVFFMDGQAPYVIGLISLLGLRIVASFIKVEHDKYKANLSDSEEKRVAGQIFCESVYLRVSVGAFVAFGIGIYTVVQNGYLYYDIFSMVFFSVLTATLTYMLSGAFENDTRGRISHSVCGFLFIFVYMLRGVEVLGIDISVFISYIAVLYASRYVSSTKSCVLGVALGICQSVLFAPIYGISALSSGFIWRLSPFLAVLSSFVLSMGYGIYSAGYQAIVYLAPELLAATLVMYPLIRFELLPKPKIIKREGRGAKSVDTVLAEGKSREFSKRLTQASHGFEAVSKMMKDISRRMKSPDRGYFLNLSLETTEAYCYTCPKREICWQNDTKATERNISRLGEGAFLRGESKKTDVEMRFLHRCPHIDDIIEGINKKSREEIKDGVKNDKLEICAKDYELMSRLLSKMGKQADKEISIDTQSSNKISKVLSGVGLVFDKAEVYGNFRKRVIATGIDIVRSSCKSDDIKKALERELKIPFDSPFIEGNMDNASLEAVSLPKTRVECYHFAKPANEKEISGDSVSVFEGEDKEFYAIICDGMGSGKEAMLTSKMCTEFLEKILMVTKEKELLLSMLNNFVRAKNLECTSSVDLLEVNTFSNQATIIKSGSAPSYIKRGEKVFKLQSKTAPIGILKELDAQRHEFVVERGDLIVMVSDGILPYRLGDDWLQEMIGEEKNVKSLAEKIVERAKAENKEKPDDMTALVALIS